jgi:hypothetical protein
MRCLLLSQTGFGNVLCRMKILFSTQREKSRLIPARAGLSGKNGRKKCHDPLVNIINCFLLAGKRERHKLSRCVHSRITISLRILGVLPVSHPGVPLAIIPGSRPGAMELRPNCTARYSNGLSKAGCKPAWTDDASKGCRSRRYLHSSLLIPQV